MFTISTENYIELFKNKEMDSYQRWFEKVYLNGEEYAYGLVGSNWPLRHAWNHQKTYEARYIIG